jgi:aspartate/methionine/tyrosine aminotransferase
VSFAPFALEEWQSRYEMQVPYNLADSGVAPVVLRELVSTPEAVERLLDVDLHYPAVNGPQDLRQLIAGLYPGVTPAQVLVTVGAAEANALCVATLTSPGDHVVVLEPGYRQVAGMAANAGCEVDSFSLVEQDGWRPDLAELERVVRPGTRLLAVSNPNNPTGAILTPEEVSQILAVAERVGAWVLADEVYRGTEKDRAEETPTFVGSYDRLVVTNSLSKAYGLSGLRLGWVVGPQEVTDAMWRRHEYATIATGRLSMHLAQIALAEPCRSSLLTRNRTLIRDGWARLSTWIDSTDGLVTAVEPEATALAFVRYSLDRPSLEVAHALREAGVLVGVGSHFGVEHHLRVTHGLEASYMEAALERMTDVFSALRAG